MALIENVKGIIIGNDGEYRTFGVHNHFTSEGEDDDFHDVAFVSEISDSEWFLKYGFDYDKNSTIAVQAFDLTKHGFSLFINASASVRHGDTYVYAMYVPYDITDEAKNFFTSVFHETKELINKHDGALFFGEPYLDGEYVWDDSAYDIDEFYDRMNISKNIKMK